MFPQGSPAEPPLASRTRPAPFRGRAGFLRPSRGFLRKAAAPGKRHFPPEGAPSSEVPPRAARFQEGCGHARQPCARRFRGPKGSRPCAARLPGAGRPSPLRRALPGRLRACPPALREALPGAERQPPLRRAIARGRKAAALASCDCPRAERPLPLHRALPGGVQACPPALREALPGNGRPLPLRRTIARGPETVALAPRKCPGAEKPSPLRPRFQEAGAAPAASTLRSPPPGTRLPAWEGRE